MAGMASQERCGREFSSSSTARAPIKSVTVIGGGLMGAGIAQVYSQPSLVELIRNEVGGVLLSQVAAQTGHSVQLVDVKEEFLEKARASISSSVQRVANKNYKDDPQVTRTYSHP